jgi:hypothetical protein
LTTSSQPRIEREFWSRRLVYWRKPASVQLTDDAPTPGGKKSSQRLCRDFVPRNDMVVAFGVGGGANRRSWRCKRWKGGPPSRLELLGLSTCSIGRRVVETVKGPVIGLVKPRSWEDSAKQGGESQGKEQHAGESLGGRESERASKAGCLGQVAVQ